MSAILFGAIAGSSIPALALALQQSGSTIKVTTPSTQLQVEQKSSSSDTAPAEDPLPSSNSSETSDKESSPQSTNSSATQVTINGETVPVENGTVERHYTDGSGSNVDISITVDQSDISSNISSSSTSVDISSNSTTATDATRGSPRR